MPSRKAACLYSSRCSHLTLRPPLPHSRAGPADTDGVQQASAAKQVCKVLSQEPHGLPQGRARRVGLHVRDGATPADRPRRSSMIERTAWSFNPPPAHSPQLHVPQVLDRLLEGATGRSARSFFEEMTVSTWTNVCAQNRARIWLALEHELAV